jgi:hypothetical protein
MQRINPDLDIVMQILEATVKARPNDVFVQSIMRQYQERGGLSKKQLEGLHGKASKFTDIPSHKLATLEAIIKKKHTKNRSELPANEPLYKKDAVIGKMLQEILSKFPQHKRVLFLKSKYEMNEPLTTTETGELQKFHKLLVK